MINRLTISIILLTLTTWTFGQEGITGYYKSNFAVGGYFERKIQLNEDLTFKYEYSGDLSYYKGSGTYKVEDNILRLRYDEFQPDTTDNYPLDNPSDTILQVKKLLIKNERLFIFDKNGELKDKEVAKFTKQFVFFGQRRPKIKKYFLEKRKGERFTWTYDHDTSASR
ncbi:MAG: hypothetical protein ACK5OS_07510 [Chryseotalea sp.]